MMSEAACLPFPNPSCNVLSLRPPEPSLAVKSRLDDAEGRSRTRQNWLLGVSWGAAGLSLATAAGLGIANECRVPLANQGEPERPIYGGFLPAAIAAFGIGTALTAIAAGSTAIALQPKKIFPAETEPRRWLQCPDSPQPQTSAKAE